MLMMNVESDRPSLRPGHPVRDRPHLDRRQHRFAQNAAVEQRLERPHRVIVPHVLVDLEQHAGRGARSTSAGPRPDVIASGFCARMPRTLRDRASTRRITPGWSAGGTATSTTSTAGSSSIASSVAKTRGHPVHRPPRVRARGSRRDADHPEPGLGISHEVAVADDESRTDHADSQVAPGGPLGQVIPFVQLKPRHHWLPSRRSEAARGRPTLSVLGACASGSLIQRRCLSVQGAVEFQEREEPTRIADHIPHCMPNSPPAARAAYASAMMGEKHLPTVAPALPRPTRPWPVAI